MPVGGRSHYNQGSRAGGPVPVGRARRGCEDGPVKTSVIVVDWRRPDLTARCLTALGAQEGVEDVEVVLVENEATPAEVDRWRRAWPGVVVVGEPENVGFAAGVVRGAAAATGEVLVLVNNDAVPEPAFLARGLAALAEGGEDVAAVAATVVLEGGFRAAGAHDPADDVLVGLEGERWVRHPGGVALLNGTGVEVTRDGNGHDRDWLRPVPPGRPEHARDPFAFSGGAVFLRRAAVDEVGGFDPSLFMYYEDVDLAWRLRLAGRRVVHAPEAVVVHRHAGSSGSGSVFVRYQSTRNRLAVVLRNGSPALVLRVLLRTLARCALDLRPAGAHRHLPPAEWGRLARSLPGLVAGALRRRRADAVPDGRRRAVEALLRTEED